MPIRLTDIPGLKPTQLNMPEITKEAARAPGEAFEKVAEGISSVSAAFKSLAPMIDRAAKFGKRTDHLRGVNEGADDTIRGVAEDPDPENQLKTADKFIRKTQTDAVKAGLNPDDPEVREVTDRVKIHTAASAAQRATMNSRQAFDGSVSSAYARRDEAALESTVRHGLGAGMITEEKAEEVRSGFRTLLEDDNVKREIDKDPRGWLEANKMTPEGADKKQYGHYRRLATRTAQAKMVKADEKLRSMIGDGTIFREEDIDRHAAGQSKEAIAEWKELVRSKSDPLKQSQRLQRHHQHRIAGEASDVVSFLETHGMNDTDYVRVRGLIDDLPEKSGYRAQLVDRLEAVMEGVPRDRSTPQARAFMAVDEHFESLSLHQVPGNPDADPADREDDDISRTGELREARGRISTELAGWLEANPKPSQGEIDNWVGERLNKATLDAALRNSPVMRRVQGDGLPRAAVAASAADLAPDDESWGRLDEYARHRTRVDELVERYDLHLNEPQRDALASFQASTGSLEQLLSRSRGMSPHELARAMMSYRNRNGRRDPAMEARRRKEQATFLHGYTAPQRTSYDSIASIKH